MLLPLDRKKTLGLRASPIFLGISGVSGSGGGGGGGGGVNSVTHCVPSTAITVTSAEQPVCMYEWLMAVKQCCHIESLDPPVWEG